MGNTVGVEAAELIAEALKEKPELERCLWADMFTGRLRSEIPNSLRYLGNGIIEANAHLVELDLSDNAFGADCVKVILVYYYGIGFHVSRVETLLLPPYENTFPSFTNCVCF